MEQINKASISAIIMAEWRQLLITREINSILKQDYSCCEKTIEDISKSSETKEIVRYIDNNIIQYIKSANDVDPAVTINSLIAQAKGELIDFCDDDDEWILPLKLSKQVYKLCELGDEYGIIYCWYEIWDDNKDILLSTRSPTKTGYIFWNLLGDNTIAGTPNMLIRKILFDKYGSWIEGIFYSIDHLIQANLSQYIKVGYVSKILVSFHHNHIYNRETNLCGQFFTCENRIRYQLKFIGMFKEYMDLIPNSYIPHYKVLIADYINLKNFNLAIIYIIKYIIIRGIDKYTLKTIVKLGISIIKSIWEY